MKEVKDNFSVQSDGYSKFRPVYPAELYEEILTHIAEFDNCWDCATGNGQIAKEMASHFKTVHATDISAQQLEKAAAVPNIQYAVSRAEQTPFSDNLFDLITVGQAAHWFDHLHFNQEVRRVAKPNGVVAIVGYGLMYVDEAFDNELLDFYEGTIGEYWDPERKHIDSHYRSIPFPFEPIGLTKKFSIDVRWDLNQLQGYLSTWSSVNRFIKQHEEDPVLPFVNRLIEAGVWSENCSKDVHFPLFVKIGRIKK